MLTNIEIFQSMKKGIIFAPFDLKTGTLYRLCLFWSAIGHGFRGNDGSACIERICRFHSKWIRKSERVTCDFEMDLLLNGYGLLLWWHNFVLRKYMLWVLQVGSTDMEFRGRVWKGVWKMTFLVWKWGQDLENRMVHRHQEEPPTGKSANCL